MVTTPVSTSGTSGSKIDVASIVAQLMEVERRPLTRIESKISSADVKISALGQFQSKLSALKDALNGLQTATNFSGVEPSYSRTGVLTATTNSSATAGTYAVAVSQLARPAVKQLNGFASAEAALTWYNDSADAGRATLRAATTAAVITRPDGTFALRMTSRSGPDFALDFASLGADYSLDVAATQAAQSAVFTVNGSTNYTRSSNSISDVISGVTLNLADTTTVGGAVTLTLSTAALTAKPKIEALVTAYNDFQALYKKETQPSAEAATRGVLNSDSTLASIMREILGSFARPLTGVNGSALSGQSDLTVLGLKLTDTGKLVLDESLLAKSTNLQSALAGGLRIGYDGGASKDLSQKITEMLTVGGLFVERINRERDAQTELSRQKTALESKLVSVQSRLTAQFAALDALLFKLSNTSEALKSSLDALANSQKKG